MEPTRKINSQNFYVQNCFFSLKQYQLRNSDLSKQFLKASTSADWENQSKNKEKFLIKIDGRKRRDQRLLTLIFKDIINAPFMDYHWNLLKRSKVIRKYGKMMFENPRALKSTLIRLERLHTFHYKNQNFIEFLIFYWQRMKFRSIQGMRFIKEIKYFSKTKSRHMQLVQKMIEQAPKIQQSLKNLQKFLMIFEN